MRKVFALLFLCFFSFHLSAQVVIEGKVLDAVTNQPLAYVNIGVPKANLGCTTNEQGIYRLKVSDSLKNKKIRFQYIGYEQKDISVSLLKNESTVLLEQVATELQNVEIKSTVTKRKTKGIKARNPLLQGGVGIGESSIYELAQEFKLRKTNSQLIDFNIFFKCWPKEIPEIKYRIKIYESKDGQPGELISKNEILKKGVVRGWNKIDLEEYQIYVAQDIFVSMEFLPDNDSKDYNIKSAGIMAAGNRFARSVSFGKWKPVAGGYTMYMTYEY